MKKWFLYVRYNLSGLQIYTVETDDLFRCIGHLYSKSLEKIDRVDYKLYSEESRDYWLSNGYTISGRNDLNIRKEDL